MGVVDRADTVGQICQMECSRDCARCPVDRAGPCKIAPGRAADTILGAVRGRHYRLAPRARGSPGARSTRPGLSRAGGLAIRPGASGAKKCVLYLPMRRKKSYK